jgi:hypothetical protein
MASRAAILRTHLEGARRNFVDTGRLFGYPDSDNRHRFIAHANGELLLRDPLLASGVC